MSFVTDIRSISSRRLARRREHDEATRLLRDRVEEMCALSWEELDRFETRTEYVVVGRGVRYRVVSEAFWDMGAWDSEMCIFVRAYAPRGRRRWFPISEWMTRGGPEDPIPDAPDRRAAGAGGSSPATPS